MKKSILIVEDNVDLQEIYRINFEEAGFRVYSSIDGVRGVVEAVEHKPGIILLDIMMPQMDGYEFLQALKNNSSIDSPIIVCSNLSQQSDIDKAYDLGADLYLRKSDFEGMDLVHRVEKFLEKGV